MDDKELSGLLFSAIQHHNESLLDDLLAGENASNFLDVPGDEGNTLLHVAVIENDLKCLVCLLKHGADPNVFDTTRARSPLHLAVELGHIEAVKTFLTLQHVNLELRDDRNLTCYEIAQFCDNQVLADLILARRAECEEFKNEFYTVMNQACTNNEPRLARELFDRYERKIVNNLPKGWQPYRDKRQYSRSMLRELINWSSSSWNNVTLLFKSASKGHTEVCKLLIDFGATAKCSENTNYSPLYVAAYGGYTSTVKLLLDSFPSLVQEVTIEKWTVLHACCLQGHSETAKLLLNYAYPETLKRRFVSRSGLYEYQFAFNLNAQDAAGQTVIYLAVSASDEPLLDTLLAFNIEAKLIAHTSKVNEPVQDNAAKRSSLARPMSDSHARIVPDRPRQQRQAVAASSDQAERTSRFYPSNQIDKIMRQLRKLQFSKESYTNSEPICAKEAASEQGAYLICPFEMDTYCDYNSKTALHLAVCQQFHNIATTLLVNGSNPNLPILFRDSIKGGGGGSNDLSPSSPSQSGLGGIGVGLGDISSSGLNSGDIGLNWLRSSKSTCLKEACRLNDERMCEILIRYGARDNQDNLALRVAAMNKNHALISMFLSLKSNVDPEFKINRKCNVEFASRYKQSQKSSKSGQGIGSVTTTFSSMFPSAPVTIDWQNLKCIQQLDPQWLIDASLAHNKRLRHPTNSLMAITRLDLSSNNLKTVHPVIFRLPSLRELNLSSNRLETLLEPSAAGHQQRKMLARDGEPMTPTSKLIESQRTAMRRSKSSQFTGFVSLENSNVIDLNEPQEWDLPYLEVLDLHDNLLIGLPDCLFELPKLTELDVSSNQLRQLPWAMWTAPSLRELLVAGNQLDELPKAPPMQSRPSSSGYYSSPRRLSAISGAGGDDVPSNGQRDRQSTPTMNQSLDGLDATSSSFMSSVDSDLGKADQVEYLKSLRDSKQLGGEITLRSKQVEVEHLNHWSKRVELTSNSNKIYSSQDFKMDGEQSDKGATLFSRLTYLNLAQNSFNSIPPVLACIATELTRLNMSHNRLSSLGDISLYPYKLKNLDLSHNQLQSWFHASHQHDDTRHCYTESANATIQSQRRPSTPSSGTSRLSQGSRGAPTIHCVHKLHQRLDNLRSFNLSHNQLRDIQLQLDQRNQQANQHQQQQAGQSNTSSHRSTTSTQRDLAAAAARNLRRHMLLYPNITALDLSFNRIQRVPESLSEFKDLSVLNLSGNTSISSLPPELGLATKLWNLGVNGCHLSEPLKSIVHGKTYKTMDIIGYLRSILEEAKPYARMKLMLVGLQGIGKTSLLEQMRLEGSSGVVGRGQPRRAPEHWTKRMGHTSRSNLRNQKGVTLSTVGVDIHDWVYQKRTPKNQQNFGPVSFSTWDFGGQEEFYATHRYFLSKRSLYLVVWRLTDGLGGILGIQQWLVNIQSRAPGSPVIIVGTHEDMIEGGERSDLVQRLQAEVHRRFMDASDHDKCGLPRIMDSIVVSTRTKLNIKTLCNRIYDVVFALRCPGSAERLLEQKIPATYLYLEEIVSCIVHDRHQRKREPVLTYDEYKRLAAEQLKLKYNKTFRDLEPLESREINYNSELHQATRFLHENGVLLHYEDSNLRDLYFLDPQWLCDILSHVVTIREINPHVHNGLMRIDDLGHSFKSIDINISGGGVHLYVVNLLNKFEVALTWNSQYLLIPSLLPNHPNTLNNSENSRENFQVKLAPRMRGRSVVRRQELNRVQAMRSTSIDPLKRNATQQQHEQASGLKNFYEFEYKLEGAINRLVLLRYLPAGFLARLQSAILSDPTFDDACEELHLELVQTVLSEEQEDVQFASLLGARPGWLCWKQGIRLALQTESTINTKSSPNLIGTPHLLTIQELNSISKDILLNRIDFKIECSQNEPENLNAVEDNDDNSLPRHATGPSLPNRRTKWIDFDMSQSSNIIVITLPNPKLKVTQKEDRSTKYYDLDQSIMARLLSKAVDYIDDLLEDWYPSLGARFAHTLGGNYLVTRIVPCQMCSNAPLIHQALGYLQQNSSAPSNVQGRASRSSRPSDGARGIKFSLSAAATAATPGTSSEQSTASISDNVVYCYYVEHCILNAYDLTPLQNRTQAPLKSLPILNLNTGNKSTLSPQSPSRVRNLQCPRHGPIRVSSLAPDILFEDLPDGLKIDQDQIERCKLIGRGALGFVFKASLHSAFPLNQLGQANQEVALKLLQPVDPGPEADQADLAAYNSACTNWCREPFQAACKSYCTARHEVNILQSISHPNIVAFIGICQQPLAIVLELAPLGSLADVFKNYKRACSRIDQFTVQKSILQVAKALEFLHQQRVIYRDLKSENILVWSFPSPFATALQGAQVDLKLADYGISRQALATGIWKGFAGTLSYLAPEILRHNGDEEYTEKVDCFSFGMFLYELLTLRPPYKQSNEVGVAGDNSARAPAAAAQAPASSSFESRPTLQKRDLIYPNYMLDLMSLCWSQEPHDRPTASQIVSIASAPEFMQIQDAVELRGHSITADSSVTVNDGRICCSFASAIEHPNSNLNLWFGSEQGATTAPKSNINVLSTSNQDQWLDCECFELNPNAKAAPITCMCLVEGDLWFCDALPNPNMYVTSAAAWNQQQGNLDLEDLDAIASASMNEIQAQEAQEMGKLRVSSFPLRNRHGKGALIGQVRSMIYVEWAQSVVILSSDGHLWLCNLTTMVCEQLEDSSISYNCVALPSNTISSSMPARSPSSPTLKSDTGSESGNSLESATTNNLIASFQLYCGQSNGISFLEICDGEVRRQSILPLAGSGAQTPSQEESIDDSLASAEISQIVTSDKSDQQLLWTAADCTVHLWSIRSKHVIRKLDCWKLVPCSESLESINIEQYYQEAKTSRVTSLVLMREQLFVGTSHGCLIVIEASSLKPMTVFRPYESQVTIVRPLLLHNRRHPAASGDHHSNVDSQPQHLVALGRGYRDLMRRYLVSNNLDQGSQATASSTKQLQQQQQREQRLVALLLTASSHNNL